MKKMFVVVSILFMAFVLTGCDDFNWNSFFNMPETTTSTTAPTDETDITDETTTEDIIDPIEETTTEEITEDCPVCEEPPVCEACPTYEEPPVCEACPTCEEPPVCEECSTCEESPVCEECPTCPTCEVCEECPTCEVCEECEISEFTWEQVMETRGLIRESNIFIRVKKYTVDRWGIKTLVETSLGSGVVYKSIEDTYYAITNHHVIDADEYTEVEYEVITFADETLDGTVLVADSSKDLAVITFSTLQQVRVADITNRLNAPLVTDEFLFAVGNPSGVQNVVTFGTYTTMSTIGNVTFQVIYHNALIYPGNSGGALTDLFGNVVGINTWGVETNDEINYAIPLQIVHEFLDLHELNA